MGLTETKPHPVLLDRYRRMQDLHRAALPAGEITAARQLEILDPHGVLSLALEIGEERAARMLKEKLEP